MDFLHYITESNDTGLRENSDHRLKDLHHKIQQIKATKLVKQKNEKTTTSINL